MTGQPQMARAKLPALGWRLGDGEERPIDVAAAILCGVSAMGAFSIGLSGIAVGNAIGTGFIAAAAILVAGATGWSEGLWASRLRLAAAVCGVLVWGWLLWLVAPADPLVTLTLIVLAGGSGLRVWSLAERWALPPPPHVKAGETGAGLIIDIT